MLQFNFHPFPQLKTKRLLLRAITPEDAEALFELRSSPDVLRYIDRPPHVTFDDSLEMIRKITEGVEKNSAIAWAITMKDDPKLVGTISFHRIEAENHRAEVGYMLHPSLWRKGIVSEAMTPVLEYGFRVMNLHSIEANINPGNDASAELLKKFGFVQEAYFRENHFFNDRFLDTIIFSLINPGHKKTA